MTSIKEEEYRIKCMKNIKSPTGFYYYIIDKRTGTNTGISYEKKEQAEKAKLNFEETETKINDGHISIIYKDIVKKDKIYTESFLKKDQDALISFGLFCVDLIDAGIQEERERIRKIIDNIETQYPDDDGEPFEVLACNYVKELKQKIEEKK